jgi:UDP-2-acetamido-3-amino-2,3-dideoxy-glucuronate N-acetyltransferase
MSRHGIRLPAPDRDVIMVCPESGFRFKEINNGVLRCLDLDEEKSLPAGMAVGTMQYDQLKK